MIEPRLAPAGWYLDGQDPRRRFWDGTQWSDLFEESEQATTPSHAGRKSRRPDLRKKDKRPKLSRDQRAAILQGEIAKWSRVGWRIDTVLFRTQASMRKTRGLFGRKKSLIVTVDRFGRVKAFELKDPSRFNQFGDG